MEMEKYYVRILQILNQKKNQYQYFKDIKICK